MQGPPPHRPDQGAAPPARQRDGLRHAVGAHHRQHAARLEQTTSSASRRWRPAGRAALRPAAGHGSARRRRSICPGEAMREPAFGLPATWVDDGLREEASFRGYTVVDPATVLTTHLTEILKDNMAELLSYAETKKLLDDLPAEQKKLVDDLVPVADHGHRHPAHPAGAAWRSASRSAICRRSSKASPRRCRTRAMPRASPSTCARGWRARSATTISTPPASCRSSRLSPRLGARLRRSAGRPGRGPAARHGAVAAAGVHHRGARALRRRPLQGELAVLLTSPMIRPLRALDHRALPPADRRHVAERDPPAGEAQDPRPGVRAGPCVCAHSCGDHEGGDGPRARRDGPGRRHYLFP